jgi:hypothetical protein
VWTAVWGAAILLTILIPRKYFFYHMFPLIVPVALLGGRGAIRLLDYLQEVPAPDAPESARIRHKRLHPALHSTTWAAFLVVACFIQWGGGVMYHLTYRSLPYLLGCWKLNLTSVSRYLAPIDERTYYSLFAFSEGDFSFLDDMDTATYLRDHTAPDEPVFVFGFEPLIYYLADRYPPTRFNSDYPLTMEVAGARFAAMRAKNRAEFLHDIATRPPVYIVLVSRDVHPLDPVESSVQARHFTEFWAFVERDYALERTIGDMAIYRRHATAGAARPAR